MELGDILRIPKKVITHKLNVREWYKSIKQKTKKSWFIKDRRQKIREEVNKLLSVSFIR